MKKLRIRTGLFALLSVMLVLSGSKAAFGVSCESSQVEVLPCDSTRGTFTQFTDGIAPASSRREDFEFDDEARDARKDSSCRSKSDDSDHVACWASPNSSPNSSGGCLHHPLKKCAKAAAHARKLHKWCITNPPPTLTGADFYTYCKDIYDNCATYSDSTARAACNNDTNIGWPSLLADYDTANTLGSASCTATRCGANDWCCGMNASTGYPLPNDGNCQGGLRH